MHPDAAHLPEGGREAFLHRLVVHQGVIMAQTPGPGSALCARLESAVPG